MPIVIPSKNIYDIEYKKFNDNQVDKVEVNSKDIKISKDFDVLCYSEDIDISNIFSDNGINIENASDISHWFAGNLTFSSYSYYSIYYYVYFLSCGLRPFYKTFSFSIPKNKNNKFIEKIFDGNIKGENNIKTSITYNHYNCPVYLEANIVGEFGAQEASYNRYSLGAIQFVDKELMTKERVTSDFITEEISIVREYSPSQTSPKLTASISFSDESNLSTAKITYDEQKDEYFCELRVLCGLIKFSHLYELHGFQGSFPQKITEIGVAYDDLDRECGYFDAYEPIMIQFSFYGNTISLDIKESAIVVGSENSNNSYSVSSNEFIQKSNEKNTIEETFFPIIDRYSNGKSTVTVRCGVIKYYDDILLGSSFVDTGIGGSKIKNQSGLVTIPSNLSLGWHRMSYMLSVPKGNYEVELDTISDKYYGRVQLSFGDPNDLEFSKDFHFGDKFSFATDFGRYCSLWFYNDYSDEGSPYSFQFKIKIKRITGKTSLNIGDVLVPMVMNENGDDVPIEEKDGGVTKFKVVSGGFEYDGAVWQKLTLLEE